MNNKIAELKEDFNNQKIAKIDFINQMHDLHKILFYYSENLMNTEIQSIELTDDRVIFTSRESNGHKGSIKFIVDKYDPRITPIEAFNFNQYESLDSRFIFENIHSDDVVFDIGTNIGWYSIHLAHQYPNSNIYSFEPIPTTFEQLKLNTEINKIKNISLNNIALSNSDTPLEFFFNPKQTGASSSKNITGNTDLVKLTCQAIKLDGYCIKNNINKLDFIKCDVEGAELFVFQGGIKTMEKLKPIVFTEMLRKWSAQFDYHPNDIIQLFSSIDYKCYILTNDMKLMHIESINEDTQETNFIFLNQLKHKDLVKKYS